MNRREAKANDGKCYISYPKIYQIYIYISYPTGVYPNLSVIKGIRAAGISLYSQCQVCILSL